MKRLLMILMSALILASCGSVTTHIKTKKEFVVKSSENDKAWSRAHGYVFKYYDYNYALMNDFTIYSKGDNMQPNFSILREGYGSDFRYTLFLDGVMKISYKDQGFRTVASVKDEWIKRRTDELEVSLDSAKKYILTGEDH